MTTTYIQNLDQIISTLPEGVTPKVTVLKTRKASKSNRWADSVRGGSSRFYAATGAGRNGREQRLTNRLAGNKTKTIV